MQSRKGGSPKPIGEILVERGSLLAGQVEKLLSLQERDGSAGVRSRFGELAVRTGWAGALDVTEALAAQACSLSDGDGLGEILVSISALTLDQWESAERTRRDTSLPLEEVMLDGGLCSQDQVRVALQLLSLKRNGAARNLLHSTFVPFNMMELLVSEAIGEAIRADGGCACSQCWSNLFALAMNELPPRYVSEHTKILDYLPRFRGEYGELAVKALERALRKVRDNPKASCRARFSDELLAGKEAETMTHDVVVHISNRHVHLSQAELELLFGEGHVLRPVKDLVQPGQYAAEETLTLAGPKGTIERIRVLGPVRKESQVEISGTDQFVLGVKAPVRESGQLEGTPGIQLLGPKGSATIEKGVIRALRHIHMTLEDAERIGVRNGEMTAVRLEGDRAMICEGVLVRAGASGRLEMHVDTDEANAAGLLAESIGRILIPVMDV